MSNWKDRGRRLRNTTHTYTTPRHYDSNRADKKFSRRPFWLNVVWWGWTPLVMFLWWAFINVFTGGIGSLHQDFHLFVLQHITAGNGGVFGLATEFWAWLAIGFLGSALITLFADEDNLNGRELGAIIVSLVLSLSLFAVPFTKGVWDAVYDESNWYLQSSPAYVQDPKLKGTHPSSLALMYSDSTVAGNADAKKTESTDGKTVKIGPTTVKQGSFPTDLIDFEPRAAAYDGALKALEQKTQSGNKTGIFDPTVTYVYGGPLNQQEGVAAKDKVKHPQINRWSAVVDVATPDDKNYANPTVGVAEWVGGMATTHVCRFGDENNQDNKFNRAFGGQHLNSLRNVIHGDYPDLIWEDRDIAGYCDVNDRPIIIIATTSNIGVTDAEGNINGAVTVPAPAGILKLTGSASGNPTIEHIPNVNAGTYPVPVYPASVVDRQLEMTAWWAGRGNKDNANFGYVKSDYASQAGNNGGYVMRNQKTGAIYSVTPQKAKSSGKSQLYTNWALSRVDRVNAGRLNELSSYVLNDGDSHATDPVTLYNMALAAVNQSNLVPNFIGNKNTLVEFTPIKGSTNRWRGYGQNPTGNTILYVDVSVGSNPEPATVALIDGNGLVVNTQTIRVDPQGGQTGAQPPGTSTGGNTGQNVGNGQCAGKPVAQASDVELDSCRQTGRAAEDELIARLRREQTAPAPSGAASPAPATTK